MWTQGTLLAIMLDWLRPLQGTSYELPSLWEKVTTDNISLISHSFPIITCGIPLPYDIIYSGYGTSSREVKILWCLIIVLINVYNILTYIAATFSQTVRNSRRVGLVSLECYGVGDQSPTCVDWAHFFVIFIMRLYIFQPYRFCCCDVKDELSTPCCGQSLRCATCLPADSLLCTDTQLQLSPGLPACCLMVKNESCHVVIV